MLLLADNPHYAVSNFTNTSPALSPRHIPYFNYLILIRNTIVQILLICSCVKNHTYSAKNNLHVLHRNFFDSTGCKLFLIERIILIRIIYDINELILLLLDINGTIYYYNY